MEENSTWIVASALGIWAFDNGPTDLSKAKQRNSNSPQPKAKAKQQGGPNDLWAAKADHPEGSGRVIPLATIRRSTAQQVLPDPRAAGAVPDRRQRSADGRAC